jgi:8-oxo-dGTP diphosphatase
MPGLGAATVVIKDGQVLMILREDFPVWALPAGGVEAGESIPQAAIREVREETGLEVALTRLVGLYSRPRWFAGSHLAVFLGHPIGGTLRADPHETRDARFFAPTDLPERMLWWYRPIIADALAGIGGSSATTLDTPWPFAPGTTRAEIYALRDQGDVPHDAVALLWQHPGPQAVIREIRGDCEE